MLDFLGIKDLKKNNKGQKKFKGHSQGQSSIFLNFIIFLPDIDRFDIKSSDQRNLTPKAIKAQKADIRPDVSKLDF
jgi:hypothetical protein